MRSTDYGATWTNLDYQPAGEEGYDTLFYAGNGIALGGTRKHAHIIRSVPG